MSKKKPNLDFFDYSCDLEKRIIYLGSEKVTSNGESGIDASSSERTIKAFHLLGLLDPNGDKPINILMNNPGGEDYHMLSIYDAISNSKSHVTITVYGQAFSAASLILQAADERVLSPHARVMIHLGNSGYYDHPKIVKAWALETDKVIRDMEQIYMQRITEKHPDFKLRQLQKLLDFDTILNAQEAIDLGLADRIL